MKKLSRTFCVLSDALVVLVALVFTVLEATLLVTLDFQLYEDELVALLQLVLKLVIAIAAVALGISSLLKKDRAFFPESIGLLVASVVMIPFISNCFGIYIAAVSACFALSHGLYDRCVCKAHKCEKTEG